MNYRKCIGLIALVSLGAAGCPDTANRQPLPPLQANSEPVKELLRRRCEKWKDVKNCYAEMEVRTVEKMWGVTSDKKVSIRYIYPTHGRLDVLGEDAESYVLAPEGRLAHYRVSLQQVVDYQLDISSGPKNVGTLGHRYGNPFGWLFPIDAKSLEQFHHLDIVEDKADKKKQTVHLHGKWRLEPWLFSSGGDCDIDIRLNATSYFPEQIVVVESNGNMQTYKFTAIRPNVEIQTADFDFTVPKGWQLTRKDLSSRDHVQKDAKAGSLGNGSK